MLVYWSTRVNDPEVYHTQQNCPEGEQIYLQNRDEGYSAPFGYRKCWTCADMETAELRRHILGR